MQKADLSNLGLGTICIIDVETGRKTLWEGLNKISSDDLEEEQVVVIPQEVADKLNEALVAVCTEGQKLHDTLQAMLTESEAMVNEFRDAIVDNLPDDKTPNPIYIPKHIKHRKKGRR